jgi:hypothetical protein
MDARNFDAAVRIVASGTSRRQVLRLLAVGALGAWFPRRGLAAPARQDEGCAAGLSYCEEQPNWAPAGCYDLSSDYLHCGDCMHQCPSAGPVEMACISGACTVIDCGDLTDCTGNLDCVNLDSDPNNCGSCGVACDSGVCEAGVCSPGGATCGVGLTYCPARSDGQPADCYDLSSDYFHCGSCDFSCPTAGFAGICDLGQCVPIGCAEGLAFCPAGADGQQPGCFDLFSNHYHCGECWNHCPPTATCVTGQCV